MTEEDRRLRKLEYDRRWRELNRDKIVEQKRLWRKINHEKLRDQLRQWREKNRERLCAKERQFRKINRQRIYCLQRAWVERNRKKVQEHWRQWHRKRLIEDPQYRIIVALRRRLNGFVRRGQAKKQGRTLSLLGCPIQELRVHLQKQFTRGMSWKNYGKVWHIDHIIPCAKFDLTDPRQQLICFNYLNLRPCFALENIRKGKKILAPAQVPLGL